MSDNPPRRRLVTRGVLRIAKSETSEEDIDNSSEIEQQEPVVVSKRFKAAKKTGKNPIEDIIEALHSGEAIMVKKEGVTSYSVHLIPNEVIISKTFTNILKKGIIGNQYWNEVLNPDFKPWLLKWNAMTNTEKYEYAEKHKLTWKHSENQRLDIMALTEAARKDAGINKYKPEYQTRAARARIKG